MNPSTRKLRHLLDDEEPRDFTESEAVLTAFSIVAAIIAAIWIAAVIAYWIEK